SHWGLLGLARLRAGDRAGAVAAAEKATQVRPRSPGRRFEDGLPWGALVLALAHGQGGDRGQARARYDEAARWLEQYPNDAGDLRDLQAEAAALLGIPTTPKGGPPPAP